MDARIAPMDDKKPSMDDGIRSMDDKTRLCLSSMRKALTSLRICAIRYSMDARFLYVSAAHESGMLIRGAVALSSHPVHTVIARESGRSSTPGGRESLPHR